jgi:hypothetical protein
MSQDNHASGLEGGGQLQRAATGLHGGAKSKQCRDDEKPRQLTPGCPCRVEAVIPSLHSTFCEALCADDARTA